MKSLILSDVADSLIAALRQRTRLSGRTLGEEAIFVIETALREERERRERQAEEWSRLAGRWNSDLTAEEEIEAIYSARTSGRTIRF